MKFYWKADVRRMMKRIPRLIVIAVCYVIFAAILLWESGKDGWNSVTYLSLLTRFFVFIPIIFGLLELNTVYGDDLKAKTLQIAIGRGISRERVILMKLLEGAFIILCDFVCLTLFLTALSVGIGTALHAEQIPEILILVLTNWLTTIVYFAIASILTINLQGTGIANLVYLVISSTLLDYFLRIILEMKAIRGLHLSRFLLSTAAGNFQSKLVLGTFDVPSLLLVFVYLAAGYVITAALFKHKELEF